MKKSIRTLGFQIREMEFDPESLLAVCDALEQGYVVERDTQVAEILRRCVSRMQEDEESERCVSLFSYLKPQERERVDQWLLRLACSDTPVACLSVPHLLGVLPFDGVYHTPKQELALDILHRTSRKDTLSWVLSSLGCCLDSWETGPTLRHMRKLQLKDLVPVFQPHLSYSPEAWISIARLYELGICHEEVGDTPISQLLGCPRLYAIIRKASQMESDEMAYLFKVEAIRQGYLPALATLSGDPFLESGSPECMRARLLEIRQILLDMSSVPAVFNGIFVSLVERAIQYEPFDDPHTECFNMVVPIARQGNPFALNLLGCLPEYVYATDHFMCLSGMSMEQICTFLEENHHDLSLFYQYGICVREDQNVVR